MPGVPRKRDAGRVQDSRYGGIAHPAIFDAGAALSESLTLGAPAVRTFGRCRLPSVFVPA